MKCKGIPFYVLVLVALIIFPAGCRSQFIFHPDRTIRATPADFNLSYETIYFETSDNIKLSGWWIPAEKQIAVVLFFHGNGGNISHFLDPAIIWNRIGLSIFTVDYRGYGISEGYPTETGTYRDAEAAWKYLVEQRGVDPRSIIIYGKSLGGSVAAWLAQTRTPSMLVIDSSFTSMAAVANDLFPWAPAGLIMGDAYDTEKYIKMVKAPVLIIHSSDDEMIRFQHGQRLYEAVPGEKGLLVLSGTHNTGFYQSIPVYEPGLKDFIIKHLQSK